ncbi:MAG: toll/interleukin-1 receptor domain-containing protein [Bryobacterales bacterium]|nr:toll/interleukin-1 receptor domain-containing protein [Bryobacterales bacterium]
MGVRIFYSYAREDAKYLDETRSSIAALRHQRRIEEWWDRRERAGVEWEQAIERELDRSQLVILLVSRDFIQSDYCHKEMTRALERQRNGSCAVVPVLIRPCNWKIAGFSHLNVIPVNAKPVSTWDTLDEALEHVGEELTRVIESLEAGTREPSKPAAPAETWSRRVLDAAVPREVPYGETHSVRTMVRTAGSGGLGMLIENEPDYDELDIRTSSPFSIPVRGSGLQLQLRIKSDTLEFDDGSKTMLLPPHDNSGVVSLSFRARAFGKHEITAELVTDDISWVSHLLKTVTKAPDDGPPDAYVEKEEVVVAAVTFYVVCIAKAMTAHA